MFVDASALTAILTSESDARQLLARLQTAGKRATSPLAIWETTIATARILDLPLSEAEQAVLEFLKLAEIETLPVPPEAATTALSAFDRYGKGRHPAALNFGDCFAYASARLSRLPLLYKGDDFPLTDIETA